MENTDKNTEMPQSCKTAVVRSFLEDMSKKHQCSIDQVMVGIVYNEMQIWKYSEGSFEIWKQLEIIPL